MVGPGAGAVDFGPAVGSAAEAVALAIGVVGPGAVVADPGVVVVLVVWSSFRSLLLHSTNCW